MDDLNVARAVVAGIFACIAALIGALVTGYWNLRNQLRAFKNKVAEIEHQIRLQEDAKRKDQKSMLRV